MTIAHHQCNDECRSDAEQFVRQVEHKRVAHDRLHNRPPDPERLRRRMKEFLEYLNRSVVVNDAAEADQNPSSDLDRLNQNLLHSVGRERIGDTLREGLETARDKVIDCMQDELPEWATRTPIGFSSMGEPEVNVELVPGSGHPVIIFDHALLVGLERCVKLYMLSFDFLRPYPHRPLRSILKDDKVSRLFAGMALCRQEFLDGWVDDPPLQPLVSGEDRLQSALLLSMILWFLIAHEMSHIASSDYLYTERDDPTMRRQEERADRKALHIYKKLRTKFSGTPSFLYEVAPFLLMKYLEFLAPHSPTHPDPEERYQYLKSAFPEFTDTARRYIVQMQRFMRLASQFRRGVESS